MKEVCAFDFDGTLTTRDTLLEFIRYVHGGGKMLMGFLLHSHLLVMMKLRLYPNWKAKQRVFSWFFKGMSVSQFEDYCQAFARDSGRLMRPAGLQRIRQAIAEGSDVVIISASIDDWVRPFFDEFGEKIAVEGTRIEVRDNVVTGRFLTANCYGQEKVNRLLARYPYRAAYHLTAFGDSRGDKELLEYADMGYYKPFRSGRDFGETR
ncbi:MAG: haloacid dehalogenase-like hydrolase [Prevotella sp.]|nr:haloacid dehalogenase-like hydrolase [Prevotella sp.]